MSKSFTKITVLYCVNELEEKAYSSKIHKMVIAILGKVAISTIYSTLDILQAQDFLSSEIVKVLIKTKPHSIRLFKLTELGKKLLERNSK